MTPVVKLVKGARSLSLVAGTLAVGLNFIPPDVALQPLIAEGTSANRYGGGAKVGERGMDQAWAFGLQVRGGTSEAQVRAFVALVRGFLALAGDPSEPLYLYFKPNSDTTLDPLWGQSFYLYEIVHGAIALGASYGAAGGLRLTAVGDCPVTLTIKPYALGQPQLVASATGGIWEDDWGQPGLSRGLVVGQAITNIMTNPVFGAATYNTGWTTGSALLASQNTDPQFCLFGPNSAYLVRNGGTDANGVFTQSITATVANYDIVAYFKKADSSAVTTADVKLIYNSIALTTTFTALGNGWYRAWAFPVGIASALPVGVQVFTDVYCAGVSFFIRPVGNNLTPLNYGDQLGNAWSGTAHASTSTRTAGQVFLPTASIGAGGLSVSHGTIRVAVTPWQGSDVLANTSYFLFSAGTTNLRAFWDQTNLRWSFIAFNNATQANGAASSLPVDVPIILHFTWTGSAITIYVNGVQVATAAGARVDTMGTNLYIGSNSNQTGYFPGVFSDFTIFGTALSQSEITADFNNLTAVVGTTTAALQRTGAIPWRFTVGGDDVVTGVYGLVNTVQKYNYCVFGGIPGSAAARVELKATHSQNPSVFGAILLGRFKQPFFIDPANFYADDSGVADLGNSSGDAYSANTNITTAITQFLAMSSLALAYYLMQGNEVYGVARVKDAGANLQVALQLNYGGGVISTDFASIASDATMRLFKTPPMIMPATGSTPSGPLYIYSAAYSLNVAFQRTTGSGNINVDNCAILPSPVSRITCGSNAVGGKTIFVKDQKVRILFTGSVIDVGTLTGSNLELDPGIYNTVVHSLRDIGLASVVTDTLTYNATWVTPRYALL